MSHENFPRTSPELGRPRHENWRSFDYFWAMGSPIIFQQSRDVRARALHHGSLPRPCQSLPVALGDGDGPCHECMTLTNDLALKLYGPIVRWIDEHHADPTGYLVKAAPLRAQDLIRERSKDLGAATRPARAAHAPWVKAVVPDELQRELLILMLFYCGSKDRPANSLWPTDRFANKLGVATDVVDIWVEEIPKKLAAVCPKRAKWVQDYLTGPLERRLTSDAAVADPNPVIDRPIGKGQAAPPSEVEEALMAEEYHDQIVAFVDMVRELVYAGAHPDEAVSQAAGEHLDPDDAARLTERDDFAQASQGIASIAGSAK